MMEHWAGWLSLVASVIAILGAIFAACAWLAHWMGRELRDAANEAVAKADEAAVKAEAAASDAAKLQASVGVPNGNGNLIEMVERALANQREMAVWQREHDHQDNVLRDAVTKIQRHLGID